MKKKSVFLLTFTLIAASFSMKVIDDLKTERSLDKAFAESIRIEQKVKFSQASLVKIKPEIEDFSDVESLDFYNIQNKTEKNADTKDSNSEKERLVKEVLKKDIVERDLISTMDKVVDSVKKSIEVRGHELSLEEPIKLAKVISKKIESTKWKEREISFSYHGYGVSEQKIELAKSLTKSVTDRISSIQSSNEKSYDVYSKHVSVKEKGGESVSHISGETKSQDDNLVFFDYSNDSKKSMKTDCVPTFSLVRFP